MKQRMRRTCSSKKRGRLPRLVIGGCLFVCLALWAAPIAAQPELPTAEQYRQVVRLISNRNYAEALAAARQLIQRTDRHERIYFRVMQAARGLGKPEAAKELFESLLQANPPNPRGYYGLGFYYDELRNYPAAIENYQHCLRALPAYHFPLLRMINSYLYLKREVEAENYLKSLLAAHPNSPAAQLGLGYYYMAMRNVEAALAAFDRAQTLNAHAADVCNYRAMTWQRVQRYQEQLLTLQTCLPPIEADLDDDYRLSFKRHLATVHTSLGHYTEALSHTKEAQQIAQEIGDNSSEEIISGILGDLFFRHAEYTQALAALGQALQLAQRNNRLNSQAEYLRKTADVYLQLGDEVVAVRHYELALEKAADLDTKLDILFSLGGLAAAQKALPQAIAYYQQLLAVEQAASPTERFPGALVYETRAFLLATEKQDEPAVAAMQQAVQTARTSGNIEPQLRAGNSLGELYLLTGDFARAAESFQQALALAQERNKAHHVWRAYFGLARGCERQGQWEQAREFYHLAVAALEGVRARVSVLEERTYFFHHKSETYQRFTAVLLQLKQAASARGEHIAAQNYAAEAFQIAERGRARALLDGLSLAARQQQAALLTVAQVQQLLKQK